MEGVTMTEPLVQRDVTAPWTMDDLELLPDDGHRYELYDGSLLVSPMPKRPHFRAVTKLQRVLDRQAPDRLFVGQTMGVDISRRMTYFVPDLLVTGEASLKGDGDSLQPAEVSLVVEVLSPNNSRHDLVIKREEYARAGIPRYWIVDPAAGTLTVLALPDGAPDGTRQYHEETVLRPGRPWRTDRPFPLTLDLADIL
jgi:Uma2 family endonuclease